MAFRKHPTYIRKARGRYQLQRGVPKDLQQALGKKVWVEPGGATYREAHRLSPAFVARTDPEIKQARVELNRSPDEIIDALPKEFDLSDPELFEALEEGAHVAVEEGWFTKQQGDRYLRVLHGQEEPEQHLTSYDLITHAANLKKPARRTKECWEDALRDFLRFAGVSHPTAATKQHAVDYRSQLLERLSSSTVKTRLAYLGGLWSVLHEVKPECEQIFEGLNRRIRVERKLKQEFALSDPDEWKGNPDHVAVLRIIHFTGARLAEIAGLRAEDIQDDRILIRPSEKRTLKTSASERAIPIHPRLADLMASLKTRSGYLWPFLHQPSTGRWGANFSKPSQRIIGVNPKSLRDRAATTLRQNGKNEAVVQRLLGHVPNSISMQYGAVPWSELQKAVALL